MTRPFMGRDRREDLGVPTTQGQGSRPLLAALLVLVPVLAGLGLGVRLSWQLQREDSVSVKERTMQARVRRTSYLVPGALHAYSMLRTISTRSTYEYSVRVQHAPCVRVLVLALTGAARFHPATTLVDQQPLRPAQLPVPPPYSCLRSCAHKSVGICPCTVDRFHRGLPRFNAVSTVREQAR